MDRFAALLTFDTTNMALKTERLLKDAGITCAVIPTPLEITAECGISLLLKGELVEKAKDALDSAGWVDFVLVYPFGPERPEL